jgi:hypothetical protein
MPYRVGNLTFKTGAGLIRALERNGALDARISGSTLTVRWPGGAEVYTHDKDGRFGDQLRWDFYADRRVA